MFTRVIDVWLGTIQTPVFTCVIVVWLAGLAGSWAGSMRPRSCQHASSGQGAASSSSTTTEQPGVAQSSRQLDWGLEAAGREYWARDSHRIQVASKQQAWNLPGWLSVWAGWLGWLGWLTG